MKKSLVAPRCRRNRIQCTCYRDANRLGHPGQSMRATTCYVCWRKKLAWAEAERAGQLRLSFLVGR